MSKLHKLLIIHLCALYCENPLGIVHLINPEYPWNWIHSVILGDIRCFVFYIDKFYRKR